MATKIICRPTDGFALDDKALLMESQRFMGNYKAYGEYADGTEMYVYGCDEEEAFEELFEAEGFGELEYFTGVTDGYNYTDGNYCEPDDRFWED